MSGSVTEERWAALREEMVARQLAAHAGPVVASTDYVRGYADQIRAFLPKGRSYKVLGTDGRKMSKSYDNAIYLTEPAADVDQCDLVRAPVGAAVQLVVRRGELRRGLAPLRRSGSHVRNRVPLRLTG